MREVHDDRELHEMELEYWRNYFNGLIESTDVPLEKEMCGERLKEKEAELGESINDKPTKTSWVGKKPEEMSPDERKEHDKYLERFVWKPGDLVYVGHKPLTEEQKALVKALKEQEEELEKKSKGVEYYINKFIEGEGKNKGRHPTERYASFDYCYNYFYSFYRENRIPDLADESNIQMSCLQLGFYLASWGMLRGSSFLIEKSVKHYEKLIKAISKMDPVLWEIDVYSYNERNIDLLMDCKEKIIDALGRENAKHWDTLVTKIMLGVFANIPAFDTYFCNNMKVYSFNKEALLKIKQFYKDNKNSFDQFKIHTYDYSGGETDILYTKAKLVDMCGFIGGQ